MSIRIDIQGLTRQFSSGSGGATTAVDHVDLTIEPGELFFLLGPSGCGKTTLLRMLAGFIKPTRGKVYFGQREITNHPPNKRNTGMMFQSYALWPHMTVADNVGYGLKIRKVAAKDRKARVDEALEAVHMAPLADRRPTQLSGGQQQRVALARALVVRPDVILLDEPLSNLDAKLRVEMRSEIRRVCRDFGLTGVYVTHDQKEALSMADRIAVMQEGRIEQVASPRDVYARPRTRFVADFLGETNLIEAKVTSNEAGLLILDTAIGELKARCDSPVKKGAVLCSIRPEAIRFNSNSSASTSHLSGEIRRSTYLGEIAQHDVELSARAPCVRVYEMHPAASRVSGERVSLSINAEDVAILDR